MGEYKVFIPCAGIGSRLELKYNKALVTVGQKPAITYIIDKFPKEVEIVIALGYNGSNIKQVLNTIYPDRKFTYINIKPYEGLNSGLGVTLLQSASVLQCPFIFCSCDTIVEEEIPPPSYNWMGYADFLPTNGIVTLSEDFVGQYRSVNIDFKDHTISEICSKHSKGSVPYIGLAGIYDYKLFWKMMQSGQELGSLEQGEVYGFKYLETIHALPFTWYDTGNKTSLMYARSKFDDIIDANILPKDDEAIWFINGKVIKFSTDSNFIDKRVKRSCDLTGYIPYVTHSDENLYVYDQQSGTILSNCLNANRFEDLLKYLTNFWQPISLNKLNKQQEYTNFIDACNKFYHTKTRQRIKQYFRTFEQIDQIEYINGLFTPKIEQILEKVDWKWLCVGLPTTRFHGDLHFENILDTQTGFIFLDWRQDFAGLTEYGDLYYDLAKLNHGIIISHELIDKNLFDHSVQRNIINFDFLQKNTSIKLEGRFKKFVKEHGYDYRKVQYLTYLIFLNIAALHHYPYSLLLFHLGKFGLWQLVKEDNDDKILDSLINQYN